MLADEFPVEDGPVRCTATVANFSSSPANVSLTSTNLGQGQARLTRTSPRRRRRSRRTTACSGAAPSAGGPAEVDVDHDVTGDGPTGGYLPLSLFGVPPIAGVGDDTISNFNVPTFYYGGEPYTRIGVVSNGYVVIGGGDGGDVIFAPQTFPNAGRPNNVIAPLWTDLNPAGRRGIRVGDADDGGGYDARGSWSTGAA